ncbi:uncharacterized protein DUF2529 [Bacillus sp. V-88]|uniref:DUF2529 domain-containing protein n=1 Tax=Rossellomorea vietnamensis TaxID=218284 RepID=UPI00054D291C|nr:DUF2529 domain-containing protein [Rossellomorea vietnamensis]OXS55789.1 hypothetical protein B1B00_18340 [Bacillus sp. DSM 27956]PRX71499.1 uncharacterized protein DUF2529 [Bacillus sp. V-88]SLK24484.1 protein of unknown function [Bacillus sp. V-88]
MIKMFTTQLTGLFKRIYDKQEFEIEDGARLLAQAAIGQGSIYIKGYREMEAVTSEALFGAEPLPSARRYDPSAQLTEADRVLIVTRYSTDEEAVAFAKKLSADGVPFVAVSGMVEGEESLVDHADIHLDTKVIKGMLPGDEIGERVSFPSSMAALYLYFALGFVIREMLEEYED